MQTINTCNFNTVKEVYLNNCNFVHTGDIMSLQYTTYGSSGQRTSLSLFHSITSKKVIS